MKDIARLLQIRRRMLDMPIHVLTDRMGQPFVSILETLQGQVQSPSIRLMRRIAAAMGLRLIIGDYADDRYQHGMLAMLEEIDPAITEQIKQEMAVRRERLSERARKFARQSSERRQTLYREWANGKNNETNSRSL